MPSSESPEPVRPAARPVGRPRDPALDVAIRTASLELLGEGGLEACALDQVARRARVGKATIYRRWPSKDDLVREAFAGPGTDYPEDDLGGLLPDSRALLLALAGALRTPRARAWLRTVPALGQGSALAAGLPTAPAGDWSAAAAGVVARARTRGEIGDDGDPTPVLGAACAVLVTRWLTGGGSTDPVADESVVDGLVEALVRPQLR